MSTRSSADGNRRDVQLTEEVHNHIRNLVDQAPPLTTTQRRRLAVLFGRPTPNSPAPENWVDALPEEDRRAFLRELVRASGESQSSEQIDRLISAWRRTAEDHGEATS